MRKLKPLPYKKGDPVVYISSLDYGIRLSQGEVTMVTTRDGEQFVYVKTICDSGYTWKRTFSSKPGRYFQQDPYPLWQLRPLNGDNMANLEKRAKQASKLYEAHRAACKEIEYEVERQARDWQYKELDRRRKALPNGFPFLVRVASRMGFKQPKRN